MHHIHHRCFYFLKMMEYPFLSLYSRIQVTADPSAHLLLCHHGICIHYSRRKSFF